MNDLVVTLTRAQLADLVTLAVAEAIDQPSHPPALLTAKALSEALDVSTRTVRRLTQAGMPTIMVCDSPRFELSAVLDWLRNRSPAASSAVGSHSETASFQPDSSDSTGLSAREFLHGSKSRRFAAGQEQG